MSNVEILCLSGQVKIRHARVRSDPYKVIRVRSFPVYFESTSRNELEQVTDEIHFPVGSLNAVP